MAKISKEMIEKIAKAFLRTLPFVPAPELYDLFQEIAKSKKSINQKINRAYDSLKETSNLIEDLQTELTDRAEKVKLLRDKYENYAQLAEIEEEKVKPLLKELEKTMVKGRPKDIMIGFTISIFAGIIIFVLGVWLGPKITPFFHDNKANKMETPIIQEADSSTVVSEFDTISNNVE